MTLLSCLMAIVAGKGWLCREEGHGYQLVLLVALVVINLLD